MVPDLVAPHGRVVDGGLPVHDLQDVAGGHLGAVDAGAVHVAHAHGARHDGGVHQEHVHVVALHLLDQEGPEGEGSGEGEEHHGLTHAVRRGYSAGRVQGLVPGGLELLHVQLHDVLLGRERGHHADVAERVHGDQVGLLVALHLSRRHAVDELHLVEAEQHGDGDEAEHGEGQLPRVLEGQVEGEEDAGHGL